MGVDFRPAFVRSCRIKNMLGHYPVRCAEQLMYLLYCRYRQNMTKEKSPNKILHLDTSNCPVPSKATNQNLNSLICLLLFSVAVILKKALNADILSFSCHKICPMPGPKPSMIIYLFSSAAS